MAHGRQTRGSVWFTVAECAIRSGYTTQTIRREIAAGRLVAERTGPRGHYRVSQDDFNDWMKGRKADNPAVKALPLGQLLLTVSWDVLSDRPLISGILLLASACVALLASDERKEDHG